MLKIRLQRVGRTNVPRFRVVLTDSRNSTKSGKFKEILGSYNPVLDKKEVNEERVKYWLSQGAQPSGTVHNFFVSKKIIDGKKINVLPKKRPIKKEEEAKAEAVPAQTAPAVEMPKEEAKPAETVSTPASEEPKKEEKPTATATATTESKA